MNDKDVLKDLVGWHVEVWSLGSERNFTDTGYLEAYDGQWIKIRQGSKNGPPLYLAIANIRLVKPL